MLKAVVFGATPSAAEIHEKIKEKYEIIAYCDNDSSLWGGGIR